MAHWQPTATLETLKARAMLIQRMREFFHARDVLAVETPTLCHTSVTDPYIESIAAMVRPSQKAYLQTSPEYAMKRLLAAGMGSIYQITKAYRQEELGRYHNPEFTMLEWYRLQFDHHQLMDEMDALLQHVTGCENATRVTYQTLFESTLGVNPHTATLPELKTIALKNGVNFQGELNDNDAWLQLLLTHCIEPNLGRDAPIFIYDFPATQAALARIQNTNPPLASRFEVYWKGIELANGFHELQSAREQAARFEINNQQRKHLGLNTLPIDQYLLDALTHGLPDCAGVALGVDRLVMLALNKTRLSEVMAFDFERA